MAEPWALVSSWTTPAPLFVLLNVVIGSIALISVFASRKSDNPPPPEFHHQIHRQDSVKTLFRAPSLFSRVTSFNFSSHSYGSPSAFDDSFPPPQNSPFHGSVEPETNTDVAAPEPQPAPIERAPSLFERITSFNRVSANESEPKLARAPSLISQMSSFDFSFYRSRDPETKPAAAEAREQHVTRSTTEPKKKKKLPPKMKKSVSEKETAPFGNEEVDAKADDFINRFKQQLRLQRLDSLLRYRNCAGEN